MPLSNCRSTFPRVTWNKQRKQLISKSPNQGVHPEVPTGTLTGPLWQTLLKTGLALMGMGGFPNRAYATTTHAYSGRAPAKQFPNFFPRVSWRMGNLFLLPDLFVFETAQKRGIQQCPKPPKNIPPPPGPLLRPQMLECTAELDCPLWLYPPVLPFLSPSTSPSIHFFFAKSAAARHNILVACDAQTFRQL